MQKQIFMLFDKFWEKFKVANKEAAAISLLLTSESQDLVTYMDLWIRVTGVTQHSNFISSGGQKQCTCDILMKGQFCNAITTVTLMDFLVDLHMMFNASSMTEYSPRI